MRFGSVCSGIEAASVAWRPLGWETAWVSEIEPFPCAVLAHHYRDVPNLGDMTALPERVRAGEVEAPDLFTGGTPCQAFSVAGKRESLADARGNLSLTFCEIADAIDDVRAARGSEPCVIVWENVPGVLSTADNAFGCFLGALAGTGDALQAPTERNGQPGTWSNAGLVLGPRRTVAWRILDAQFFGLAQRRKRVFVVASARDGFDPGAVLFEFDGVRSDSAPRRETREEVADCIGAPATLPGVSGTLTRQLEKGGQSGQEPEWLLPVPFDTTQITSAENYSNPKPGDPCHPLAAGAHPPAVAFDWQNGGGYGNANEGLGITIEGCGPLQRSQTPAVAQNMAVRRFTPVECERLQGFEDGYTLIPLRGYTYRPIRSKGGRIVWRYTEKCKFSADGPRYKALGNSWAVPNVRWIGARIQSQVEQVARRKAA